MTEYVHLIGAEDVLRAGLNMRGAADDITRAASTIDGAADRISRAIDRFEAAANRLAEAAEKLAQLHENETDELLRRGITKAAELGLLPERVK